MPCVFLSRALSFLSRALSRRWLLLVRLLAVVGLLAGVVAVVTRAAVVAAETRGKTGAGTETRAETGANPSGGVEFVCGGGTVDAAPPFPLPPPNACVAADFLLPLLLPELELLLSSAPDSAPFCCCSALTISCFASDVFVPGLVRLIFILSPLSSVA